MNNSEKKCFFSKIMFFSSKVCFFFQTRWEACDCCSVIHGSRDLESGKTWKNGKAFSSQGNVREICQDWKSQGILPKILEKQENLN